MLKNFTNKIKSLVGADDIFSNISVLPFSKYKKNYSKSDYLNNYGISLYVNRAVNKRAEKVSEIEFQLKRGDKIIENDPILDLLNKPNKSFSKKEFYKLYQKYMDIFGEVYIFMDSEGVMGGGTRINELHLFRSDTVKPFFNDITGELTKIEHHTATGTKTIPSDDIIYARNPDPSNPLRGESLLASGIRQIETATQIDEYQSMVLENGGRVEGVFNFKATNLNKQQLTEIKENFQEEYANASKAGLPLFLSGDANFQRLGLDPSELAYLETKKLILDDIVILTSVPKDLLGINSDSTFANADAAIRVFLRETIKPLTDAIASKMNNAITDDSLELTAIDPTPENKEEIRKAVESGIKNYYMTPNEARTLVGLDPIKGGDDLLAPFSIAPIGKKTETDKAIKQKAIKSNHPLSDKDNREIYHALCVKRLDSRQKRMKDIIDSYFDGQNERLVEKLQVEKQAIKKDLIGDIFIESLEIDIAKETVLPILEELLKESAELAKEIAGSDWEYVETVEIKSWLDKKTAIFAEQINDTTFSKLKDEFAESLSDGEDRNQLIERINNTYGDISKARSETIARTEVHGVTQYGTKQGYKQAGLPIKIWVWAPGTKGGIRENHKDMDGEEKPIDTTFSNGLDFPGDPSGGADDTINCQCFI